MPNIKDKSTVEAIAREYCSNGRNKGDALRTIGYSDSYCDTLGIGKVYSNIRVKDAIARIDSRQAAQQGRTVKQIDDMYTADRELARALKQPSAAVSAVTGIARLYGMDKDAGGTEEQQALAATVAEQAKLIAEQLVLNANKPKLVKDTG